MSQKWTMSYVANALSQVVEAARIRQEQWALAGRGLIETDDALCEASEEECRHIAEDLAHAISVVDQFIIATRAIAPVVDAEDEVETGAV